MASPDLISAFTALFITGMIWLRTRMQYSRQARGRLHLGRAGRVYFAAALGVLVVGWYVAPALGPVVLPGANTTPTLMRVVWFLATYYVFILVHRALKNRHVEVFHPTATDSGTL